MTIYIVKWEQEGTNRFSAESSYKKLQDQHKVLREIKGLDINIQPENEAITKHTVKTQSEVIDLINSLK